MNSREAINYIFNANSDYVNQYKQDFMTDAYALGMNASKEPNLPFIHIAYPSGTALILLHSIEGYPSNGTMVPYLFSVADRYTLLDSLFDTISYYTGHGNIKVSYYNGASVDFITIQDAIDICKKYITSIKLQWYNEGKE